jgi:carboxypeptidase T
MSRPKSSLWLSLLLVVVILLVGAAPAAHAQAGQPALPAYINGIVVRVFYNSQANLNELAQHLDIWEVNKVQGYLVTALGPTQIDALTRQGYRVEIDWARTQQVNQPRLVDPKQINGIPGYSCYRTLPETETALQTLATNHPNLAELSVFGQSWEKVHSGGMAGHDLYVLKLTNKEIAGPKPVFFLMAEIHAREYATAETALRFAEFLLENYDTNPDITWLLDRFEIHIVPMFNPDGRVIAETGIMWRKNTNNTNGGNCTPPDAWTHFGTDLNRNNDFHWGGAGTDPCEQTYQGPTAASDPETVAFQNYVASIFADQRGPGDNDPAPLDTTGTFITLHAHGGWVMWPWGWSSNPAPNGTQLQTLGRKLAYFNHYLPMQDYELYMTTGTSDEWAYGTLGVAAYTYEIGNDFFQDCVTFENSIYPTNQNSLLYAFKTARRPYQNPAGPDSLNVAVAPGSVSPGVSVTLTATANDTRYANSNGAEPTQNIQAARYSIDNPSWVEGAITYPTTAADGNFNQKVEAVTAAIDTTGLGPGRHIVYVESQDANNNWGVPSAAFLQVSLYGLTVSPLQDTKLGFAGASLPFTLTVTNAGVGEDTFDISLTGSPWAHADASVGPIPPGASQDVTVIFDIPSGVPPRTLGTAVVQFTSRGDPSKTASSTLTAEVGFRLFLPTVSNQ